MLWASDSDRARDTASYVAAACGLAPTFDPRLREYSLGPREGLFHHEFEADDPAEYAEFARANWDGVALVVSHGAAIRTAVAALLGWSPEQALTLRGMDNCGWTVLQGGTPGAPWRLGAYNRIVPVSTDAPPS